MMSDNGATTTQGQSIPTALFEKMFGKDNGMPGRDELLSTMQDRSESKPPDQVIAADSDDLARLERMPLAWNEIMFQTIDSGGRMAYVRMPIQAGGIQYSGDAPIETTRKGNRIELSREAFDSVRAFACGIADLPPWGPETGDES